MLQQANNLLGPFLRWVLWSNDPLFSMTNNINCCRNTHHVFHLLSSTIHPFGFRLSSPTTHWGLHSFQDTHVLWFPPFWKSISMASSPLNGTFSPETQQWEHHQTTSLFCCTLTHRHRTGLATASTPSIESHPPNSNVSLLTARHNAACTLLQRESPMMCSIESLHASPTNRCESAQKISFSIDSELWLWVALSQDRSGSDTKLLEILSKTQLLLIPIW